MTELSIQLILQVLPDTCETIYLAYSGGVDSHVLLHLCASNSCLKHRICAVYIHHGLQSGADDWAEHCRQQCAKLDVSYRMLKVSATPKTGESPEAAARQARYAALQSLVQANDVVLVAQHQEDQLETVLLQLFRGSGIKGLAAMPLTMLFGEGMLLRPFLNVPKIAILQYGKLHGLHWVEDPSNQSNDFDRNFLRNQILPQLKQRWPSLDKTLARTAKHCGDAAQLIDDWSSAQGFANIYDVTDNSLLIEPWLQYNPIQRNYLLRYWLQNLGLKPPSQAKLQAIVDQVIFAKADAQPQIQIQHVFIRKYKQKLFSVGLNYFCKEILPKVWPVDDEQLPMKNGYTLLRIEDNKGIDKRLWDGQNISIAYRRGGERLKLPGRTGHHCLKKLFQSADIPPWERELRPLVYINGELIAVAGLWIAAWGWRQGQSGDCYRLVWQPNTLQYSNL